MTEDEQKEFELKVKTELESIKTRVTEIGHFVLKQNLPLEIDRVKNIIEPFADLERKIDRIITNYSEKLPF